MCRVWTFACPSAPSCLRPACALRFCTSNSYSVSRHHRYHKQNLFTLFWHAAIRRSAWGAGPLLLFCFDLAVWLRRRHHPGPFHVHMCIYWWGGGLYWFCTSSLDPTSLNRPWTGAFCTISPSSAGCRGSDHRLPAVTSAATARRAASSRTTVSSHDFDSRNMFSELLVNTY